VLSSGPKGHSSENVPETSEEEKTILDLLEVYPKTVDDVIVGSKLPINKVNELLLTLELKGLCVVLPGRQYQRKL
jgi:predicted Rossmann fold nucleotide-binding protein DprA/Smf involved in DNA uptake